MRESNATLLKYLRRAVTAVSEELAKEGYTTEDLDALTRDCSSELAFEANNNGPSEQVEFLLRGGWTPEDILGRLKIQREEDR